MTLNYKKINLLYSLITLTLLSCGSYSFTGASIPEGTETFQVNFFENDAGNNMGSIFEPGLDRDFTLALQNILQNQTNLQLVSNDGDLVFEGEITEYRVSPMTATSDLTAAQNRLSISVNVRFFNIKRAETITCHAQKVIKPVGFQWYPLKLTLGGRPAGQRRRRSPSTGTRVGGASASTAARSP